MKKIKKAHGQRLLLPSRTVFDSKIQSGHEGRSVASFEIILQSSVILVTLVMMGFVWRIGKQIRVLREGKEELNRYVGLFENSTQRAQDAAMHLHQATEKTGVHMEAQLQKANRVSHELQELMNQAQKVSALMNQDVSKAHQMAFSSNHLGNASPQQVKEPIKHSDEQGASLSKDALPPALSDEKRAMDLVQRIFRETQDGPPSQQGISQNKIPHRRISQPRETVVKEEEKEPPVLSPAKGMKEAAHETMELIIKARQAQAKKEDKVREKMSLSKEDWPELVSETDTAELLPRSLWKQSV